MNTHFLRFPLVLIPALLSLVSCADFKIANEFPSSFNGSYRSFGYAGTPTEVYKKAYDCGLSDRREHRSRNWRRHNGTVPTELEEYHILGYADGYAGKVRSDCAVPCWKTTLERRTYSGACCASDTESHTK